MPQLSRLRREETVLLVIDVQEKLLPVMLEAERVARNCALLITAARRLDLPVIVTEQYPARLGATVGPLREALGEFTPIEKLRFSALVPPVQALLEGSGRRTILLAGIEGHVCVLQTALDLLEAGYTVFGASDAISSRQAWNRASGWERMRSAGAVPASTESAIFELLGEAGTPDFKALQPLIK